MSADGGAGARLDPGYVRNQIVPVDPGYALHATPNQLHPGFAQAQHARGLETRRVRLLVTLPRLLASGRRRRGRADSEGVRGRRGKFRAGCGSTCGE